MTISVTNFIVSKRTPSTPNPRGNDQNASLIQHLEDHLAGQVSVQVHESSSPGVDRTHLSWVLVSPHHGGLLGLPGSGFWGGRGRGRKAQG